MRHFAVSINSWLICTAFPLQLASSFTHDQCCYSMPLVFDYHFWLYYRSCLKMWLLLIWATSSPSAQLDLRDGDGERETILNRFSTSMFLPRNLTWNLKMMVSKRNHLFQGLIFRFHVKFQGCRYLKNFG